METEIKAGARNNAKDQRKLQMIHDLSVENGAACDIGNVAEDFVQVKDVEPETLVFSGSEVKALENGKVAGYLIQFTTEHDPDLTGDFFEPDTNFGEAKTSPVMYHHGLDKRVGLKVLGTGELKVDDVGVWIEAQLNLRDSYEKAIHELAKKGKLGWSSGTAGHLVRRESRGKAQKVLSWPLGLDASLTPTPAEPRNSAVNLKSIEVTELETEAEDPGKVAEVEVPTETTITQPEKVETMADETKPEVKPDPMIEVVASLKAVQEELKSMKAAPVVNAGAPALNLKTKPGDSATKAFSHFMRTGDAGGIRTGEAYDEIKANLVEGTQYYGQEAVPTEVLNMIYKFRDPISIPRAAGCKVYSVGSDATVIPIEKARQADWAVPGEVTAYTVMGTITPMDKVSVTISKYAKNIPASEELLEDSVFPVEEWIASQLGRSLASTENALATTNSVSGVVYNGTVSAAAGSTASSTAITASEFAAEYGLLAAEYRDNAVCLMTQAVESAIRSIAGSPLFGYGNGGYFGGAGAPNVGRQGSGWILDPSCRIFNFKLAGTYYGAMIAAGFPVCFGNFEAGYAICERRAMTIKRDPYSNAKEGIVNFLASIRMGHAMTVGEAFQVLKMKT